MAEPEQLGESILRRYAESPGVIPRRFGMGIVRRMERQEPALAGEIQRRWTPEHAEGGGVQWPEVFAPFQAEQAGTAGKAAVSEQSGSAAGKGIQRAAAVPAAGRSVDSAEPPWMDAVREGAAPSSTPMPVVKVPMKTVPAAGVKTIQRKAAVLEAVGALPVERQTSASDQRSGVVAPIAPMSPRNMQVGPMPQSLPVQRVQALRGEHRFIPAVVNRVGAPAVQRKVRIQEHTPAMLRDAEMASFQVGAGSALPASLATPAVLPRTVQRSAAPAAAVDIAHSSSIDAHVTHPVSQGGTRQANSDSSDRTDRTMQQILRRLAIERERRGGGKWL